MKPRGEKKKTIASLRPAVRRGHGENQYSLCVHESNSRLHAEAHTRPRGCLKAHRALERVRCFGRRSLVPDNRHFCCLSRAHSRHASTGRARGRHRCVFTGWRKGKGSGSTVRAHCKVSVEGKTGKRSARSRTASKNRVNGALTDFAVCLCSTKRVCTARNGQIARVLGIGQPGRSGQKERSRTVVSTCRMHFA